MLSSVYLRIRLSEGFGPAVVTRRTAPGLEVPAEKSGGADRSRTDDIQLAKLALYQLSYSPLSDVGSWWA